MKNTVRKIIQKIRAVTPLWLRVKVGPYIAYVVYIVRVYVRKNPHAPHVLSIEATIDLIGKEDLSAIRFGDGEISLIDDTDLAFQAKNKELAEKLKLILQTNEKGLLICIPGIFGRLNAFTKRSFWFTLHHLFKHGHIWQSLLSPSQTYGDAFLARPYLTFKDTSNCGRIFDELKGLWEGKDAVLIEGEKSRLGVGNDLFLKARSLERILCPSENAFAKYATIKSEAFKIGKDKLVLLSLGPTAKVLAYELFSAGYRVIDIGHIDMEYEMFLRKQTKLTKVAYKYFNEINERNPEECTDPRYLREVIARIR